MSFVQSYNRFQNIPRKKMHFVLYTAFISRQNVQMVMFYTPNNKAETNLRIKSESNLYFYAFIYVIPTNYKTS